jgi:hypothetical protein
MKSRTKTNRECHFISRDILGLGHEIDFSYLDKKKE